MDRTYYSVSSRFFLKPERIIVDNNSTDETENIVRHFTQDPLLNDKK